jgi:hypothetical protein
MNNITVSWFSAGVSSAVATYLLKDQIDFIIFQDIEDQHEDTYRFISECEELFEKPVIRQMSPYKSVNNACRGVSFINGPQGASCTRILKKRERQIWEAENRFFNRFNYIWGMDATETDRADRIKNESMREDDHFFPLIERGISKPEAHAILEGFGIRRPAMYDLGYPNNNCIGCVKGGMGYWNKIRIDFPEVFQARAEMEREIGASCINGVYLDELDPDRGRDCKIILPECGVACEMLQESNQTEERAQI